MNIHSKPLVLGIAGGAGSGKTTLSRYLKENLPLYNVRLLEMDRFYKHHKPQFTIPPSEKLYDDFNHPDAVDIALIEQEITRIIGENQTDVLVIDGFLLFHFVRLLSLLDLKIYVDCPPEERFLRRIDSYANWGIPREELSEYIHIVSCRHDVFVEPTRWCADLVVNTVNQNNNKRTRTMLLEWITNRIGER